MMTKENSEITSDGSEWEDTLEKIVGNQVSLTVSSIKHKKEITISFDQSSGNHLKNEINEAIKVNNQLEDILKSSETLMPEFLDKTKIEPYRLTKTMKQRMKDKNRK